MCLGCVNQKHLANFTVINDTSYDYETIVV